MLQLEYGIRNEILTKLFHTEKASKRHPEKKAVKENSNKFGIHHHAILFSMAYSSENLKSK